MEIPFYVPVVISIFFGILAIFFSYRDDQKKKIMDHQNQELSRSLYELSVISSVSAKIGYSLNTQEIVEVIVRSIENLFSYSTVSYALVSDKEINIHTEAKQGIDANYSTRVQSIILLSLYSIEDGLKSHPIHTQITYSGDLEQKLLEKEPQSYFNVPISIHNKLVGVITITSTIKNIYHQEDMIILYKIVNRAQSAIERLAEVIETEKGKLDSLIRSLPSGAILFEFNKTGLNLATLNSSARSFLRLPEKPTTEEVIVAFDGVDLISSMKKTLLEQAPQLIPSVTLYGKDLKIFTNPVFFSRNNKLIGISVTIQDISLEKQIEKLRENFTNMVVHELRAPLTSISGAASLLLSEGLADEEKKKMLHVISDSSKRLLTDVGDLLDAAKMDAGHFTIMKGSADINKVVQDRVEFFSPQAKVKDIHLELQLGIGIPTFSFDAQRIGQVVTNLISNSIKFTPQGGKITIKTSQNDGFVNVCVSDTGMGIPDEQKSFLFSKFGQLQTSYMVGGTGLGLYISKGIVESHGGTISLESGQGQGTAITFTLPIKHEAQDTQTQYQGKMVN